MKDELTTNADVGQVALPDGKPPVVCSACGSNCDKTGFSPQGSNDWFCSQECYDDYFDDDDFDSFDDYNIEKEKRKKGDTFEMDFIDLD